ncbi:MAG: hypothetical protein K2N78_04920 [Oscillospiraceae bacterium]|nr:hypothetical protein [Oscillospiraceae bacterium]
MTEKVTLTRRDGLPMPLIHFAAPEHLAEWYAGGLQYSLERGERRLAISCFDVSAIFGFDLAKTAQLVLRAVTDVLYDHPEAESLEILCDGEAALRAYSFCWNLWYAETKPH